MSNRCPGILETRGKASGWLRTLRLDSKDTEKRRYLAVRRGGWFGLDAGGGGIGVQSRAGHVGHVRCGLVQGGRRMNAFGPMRLALSVRAALNMLLVSVVVACSGAWLGFRSE